MLPDIEGQQLDPAVAASLHKVQCEVLLGVGQVAEQELGDGLQATVGGCQAGESRPEDTEGAHHLGADAQLGQLQLSQGFEGQEVELQLVWYKLAAADVFCGADNTESFKLTTGVGNIGKVQPLVLRVHWRTRTLQPLADGV